MRRALRIFGFGFGRAFLDRLWGAFDEGLGFGVAESRDRCADFLDDVDLACAGFREDDVECGLLFSGRCRSCTTAACWGCCHRCCGADAPLGFELFHEISDFQDGESAEAFNE